MNENSESNKDELESWIKQSLQNENFEHLDIRIEGTTDKDEGYTGDIVFATVLGSTKENAKKEIGLVIKTGKKGEEFRKVTPVKRLFQREIYFYDTVLPLFYKFQLENNVEHVFDSVAKCYKTFVFDDMEVIIIENLKKKGYKGVDRKKPLDLNHIKIILMEYGRFHALSFALKDKKKEEFDRLTKNYDDVAKGLMNIKGFKEYMQKTVGNACDILKEKNEVGLLDMFQKVLEKGPYNVMMEILDAVEPQSAIIHGDAWSNNYMFKYDKEDPTIPLKACIIDWQVSKLHSPILDVSHIIYNTCSAKELEHFDELMEVYYSSFAACLTELGCNAEELFSFADLKMHWKKYSLYGLVMVTLFIHVILCDKENAPELNKVEEGQNVAELFEVKVTNQEAVNERLITAIKHYYTCDF